jgi:hypothetical protein
MPSPATLVDVEDLQQRLRLTDPAAEEELSDILAEAEDIILTFIGDRFDAEWTDETVPGAVRAAILKQAAFRWKFRGDDEKPPGDESGLAPGVRWMLQANGYRDLTIG